MREILFRGKRLDNGEWVEGFLVKDTEFYGKPESHTYIINHKHPSGCYGQDIFLEVDPTTVGQYTGLTANDKRIFEGDIVEVVSINNDHCQRGAARILCVRYIMGNPCVCYPGFESGAPLYPLCIGCSIEIIGNIHDNPELLEGGANDD